MNWSASIPRDRAAMLEQRVIVKTNNKASLQDDNQASGSSMLLKGKVSRAPRTGSIMVLDSSSKVHLSSGALQGWEQPNLNKIQALGVGSNQKRLMSTGSSSHAMVQWSGQRPHKNSRTRRANLVSPVSNAEAQISSQGFATPDFGARASIGTGRSLLGSRVDNATPKIKREHDNVSSPFGLSKSEESGDGDFKSKEKGVDSSEVTLPASQKAGAFLLPTRKNKMSTNEIGDGVRRQGRSGNSASPLTKPGVHPMREKLENLTTTKPIQSVRSASDKNRSKTGRPPSKKLKDRKASTRVGSMLNNVSSDFTGESDDDHDELFAAATSARNASSLACAGPSWKKIGSIFNSVCLEDTSHLRQQLSLAEELDESLSQMFGDGYNVLACRGSNSSKSVVRKVSKQVALAFVKRTLARCQRFEQTGSSCCSEPALQDVMFSVPPCSNEAKSVDCIGSGTASNTYNETSNHQAEARGSGAVSSTSEKHDSLGALPAVHSSEHAVSKYGSMLNKGRKREVLIDDVVGSASSRVTSTVDGTVGVRGKRSERDRDQRRDNLRNTSSVSGSGRTSLDGCKGDWKTKSNPKQKRNHLTTTGNGFNGRLTEPFLPSPGLSQPSTNPGKMTEREARSSSPSKIHQNSSKEADEPIDFANLQLNGLRYNGSIGCFQ